MGQNNSQTLFSKGSLTAWRPLQHSPSIFQNVITHEQAQRFIIRTDAKDVDKEIAYFNKRIAIRSIPCICQVLCIQNFGQTKGANEYQDWAVYTCRIFNTRQCQWTCPRLLIILEGIIYLVKTYQPFRITEKMIWTNEKGQIKMWISQNPAFNRPDNIVANQEQTLASFAAIIVKKNIQAASLLIGCKSLNQAYNRLSRPQKQGQFASNYTNRTFNGVETITNPKQNYRNVFHQNPAKMHQIIDSKQKGTEDNFQIPSKNNYQLVKLSKPPSKVSMNVSNKIFQQSENGFTKTGDHHSNNQSSTQTYNLHKYCQDEEQTRLINQSRQLRHGVKNINTHFPKQNITQLQRNTQHIEYHNFEYSEIKKQQSNGNSFTRTPNQSSFQPNKSVGQNPFFYPNLVFSAGPKHPITPSPLNKDESITIINNNIGSIVNNITHNHQHCNVLPQKAQQQFRYKTPNFAQNLLLGGNYLSKSKQKVKVPLFIQQRKYFNKTANSSQMNKRSKSSEMYSKMSSYYHKAETPNKSTQESFNHTISKDDHLNLNRKDHKLYTFNNGNQNFQQPKNYAKNAMITNSYFSKTHQTPHKTTFGLHEGSRAKTTDFSQYSKSHLQNILPNHSFRQNEKLFSASFENNFKGKYTINQEKQDKTIQQEVGESMPTTKSIDLGKQVERYQVKEDIVDTKVNLKKMLKMQFGSLLGPQFIPEDKKKEQKKPQQKQAINKKQQQIQEGCLKQKIKMKQVAFAQLKKQAMAVLTDLF